jgi:hypothetical protein
MRSRVRIDGKEVALSDPAARAHARPFNEREKTFVKVQKRIDDVIDYFAMIIAEPKFVAGEREVLPLVLSLYFERDRTPPRWARRGLVEAFHTAGKNWDDVLGKHPKRKAKLLAKQKSAYGEAQKILKQDSRKISDNDLFPVLGEVLGIPSGTAKDHYYSAVKRVRNRKNRLTKLAKAINAPNEKDLVVLAVFQLARTCRRLDVDFRDVLKDVADNNQRTRVLRLHGDHAISEKPTTKSGKINH